MWGETVFSVQMLGTFPAWVLFFKANFSCFESVLVCGRSTWKGMCFSNTGNFTKWFKITLPPARLSPRSVADLFAKIVLSHFSDKSGWTARVQKSMLPRWRGESMHEKGLD